MKRLLLAVVGFLMVGGLLAQINTTPAAAANVQWGQKVASHQNAAGTTLFWFLNRVVAGRSYCVETGQGEYPYGDQNLDTVLAIFKSDTTTLIVSNDDFFGEPKAYHLSRACFVAAATEDVYTILYPCCGGTSNGIVTLRFSETTLFCPWFFIAGDYNAFSLIRNTSNTILDNVVVTWRGLNGAVAGTTTVSISANGTVILNARDFVNPGTFSNGSIEIAHPGALDQIKGSTTTLSGTTGLGFDAMFEQRTSW